MEKRTDNVLDWLPPKAFFSLRECADLKGVNYKTMNNHPHLKPVNGTGYRKVGGRKLYDRQTVIDWLFLDDSEMEANLDNQ